MRSSIVDLSTPYIATHLVRHRRLHSVRSARVDDALAPFALQRVDELRRAVRGHDDDAPDVAQQRPQAVRPGGKRPRHTVGPHPVDPALEHRRLPAPPRRVDEHERFAPTQVVGVALQRGRSPGFEMGAPVVGVEARIESLGVQVGEADDVAVAIEGGEHPIAGGGDERRRIGMAIDDEDVHDSRAILASTSSRNWWRRDSLAVSMP